MKNYIITSQDNYNSVIVHAKTKEEALDKAENFMQSINKFSQFYIEDVIETKLHRTKHTIYQTSELVTVINQKIK